MEEQKRTQMIPRTFSDLPENVIDEILCRLPIKDAVRTGILSRSWRHRWKSMPDLYNLSDAPEAVVPQIILLHSGSVRLFKAKTFNSPAVFDWIPALSCRAGSNLRTLDLTSNFYLQLHSLARFFPCLTHLHLSKSDTGIHPSYFSGFTSLRTLHLDGGRLRGQLSKLIAACPALETLTLMYMRLEGLQCLDIIAPNLRWLKLVEISGLLDFNITSALVLEMAVIDCCVLRDGNLMKVCGGMAYIRKLELGASTLEFLRRGIIPPRLPICFEYLRSMSLSVNFGDMRVLLVTLCLVRSTSNLQELELKCCFYNTKVLATVQDFSEVQEYVGLFDKLETLKIIGIKIGEAELDFVQFVFAKAQVLKTTMISFSEGIRNKELLMKKLLEFPMVSNKARIMFECKIFKNALMILFFINVTLGLIIFTYI